MRINRHLFVSLIGLFSVAITVFPGFLRFGINSFPPAYKLLVAEAVEPEIVNVYRLHIPHKKAHFYTTSVDRYNKLISKVPVTYNGEGKVYRAFSSALMRDGHKAVPLHKFLSTKDQKNYWTADLKEYENLLASPDKAKYEGIDFYVFSSPEVRGTIPLFHLAVTDADVNLWTVDQNEFSTLVARGWVPRGTTTLPSGVVGYVLPN